MSSIRSPQAILSLPHKYRVPLGRKDPSATLSMTIRKGELSLIYFHHTAGNNLRPFRAPPSPKGKAQK